MSEAASKVFLIPDYEDDEPGNKLFPEIITIRALRGTRAALSSIAQRKKRRPTEIARQLIERGIEMEGAA